MITRSCLRLFLVPMALSFIVNFGVGLAEAQNIAGAEFYIDTDPGQGQGTPAVAKDGNFDQKIEALVCDMDTSQLAAGQHTLYIRAMDANGHWGTPRQYRFEVRNTPRIAAAEYFIDNDPGIGNGIPLSASDGVFNSPIEELQAMTGPLNLTTGLHKLQVRARDSYWRWSTTETIDFKIVLPTVTVKAMVPYALEEGRGRSRFKIMRSLDSDTALAVNYTATGTAKAGSDYQMLSGTVTIPAGMKSALVVVKPLDDSIAETKESIVLKLLPNSAYTVGSPAKATIFLLDNEKPQVKIRAVDSTASEPGSDTGLYRVSRLGSLVSDLIVGYSISGTATPGADYIDLPGSIKIPAGLSYADFGLYPQDDTLTEPDETVGVRLAPNPAYQLGQRTAATVTISDNDN